VAAATAVGLRGCCWLALLAHFLTPVPAQPAAAGAFVAAAAAAFAVLHAVLPTRSECLQLTCECAAASQPALQLKEQPCPTVQELQPAPLPQQQGELLQCLQPALLLRQQGELLHCLQPALLLDMQQR